MKITMSCQTGALALQIEQRNCYRLQPGKYLIKSTPHRYWVLAYQVIFSLSKISVALGEHSAQVKVKNTSPKMPPGTHVRLRQFTWTCCKQRMHSRPSAVMSTTGWLQYLQVLSRVLDIFQKWYPNLKLEKGLLSHSQQWKKYLRSDESVADVAFCKKNLNVFDSLQEIAFWKQYLTYKRDF